MAAAEDGVEITDSRERRRFEVRVGGELVGHLAYQLAPGRITYLHTEVDREHEGRGLGSRLARVALDAARERGLEVVPRCSFVAGYIRRNPGYGDLVVAS